MAGDLLAFIGRHGSGPSLSSLTRAIGVRMKTLRAEMRTGGDQGGIGMNFGGLARCSFILSAAPPANEQAYSNWGGTVRVLAQLFPVGKLIVQVGGRTALVRLGPR